ncbi:MAG: GNAT family N-acetyltransferase [Candidatus Altiarchaeota archaeon]
MESDLDGIGVKEIGKFNRQVKDTVGDLSSGKASKHDIYSELSIELDGISELTRINPNKFLNLIKKSVPDYDSIVESYRKKVFELTDSSTSETILDSIVENMISLNLLKSHIFEAGGFEKALDHIAEKYGATKRELVVDTAGEQLTVARIQERHEVKEASRIITSFYGPKVAEELYSIFMISKVGRLLAVKDSFGKILGVIQILYDKWGDSYIHAYCVLKNYRGFGVGSMLLDAVEQHAKGGRIWATRHPDMVYSIRNFLSRGYAGKAFIRDYWKEGSPRIVFEKDLGNPLPPLGFRQKMIPYLEKLDPSVEAFTTTLDNNELMEQALNSGGYEVIGLYSSKKSASNILDYWVLRKSESSSFFLSREYDKKLPDVGFGGLKQVLIEDYESISEVIGLEDAAGIDPSEDYGTFKMLTLAGMLVGFRDSGGNLVASTGLVWDGEGGIFCHALNSFVGERTELNTIMLRYVSESLCGGKSGKVYTIAPIEDMGFLKSVINGEGFSGTMEFLNPYDNGHNYLMIEKRIPPEGAVAADPAGAPFLKSFMNFSKSDKRVLVSSRNYSLTALILKEGYVITSVVSPEKVPGVGVNEDLFLMSR